MCKHILFLGLSFLIISSCSGKKKLVSIWVAVDGKSLLEIKGEKWKIIYSEVSGLCTEMSLIKDHGKAGVLEIDSPLDFISEKTINYQINDKGLNVQGKTYLQSMVPAWDSILVYKSANSVSKMNLHNKFVPDFSMSNELLVALIMAPQFELINPSNTSTDYLIKYVVWDDNKVIGSKIGGSNLLCIH